MLGVLSFSEDAFSSEGTGPLIVGSLSATGAVGSVSASADANVTVTTGVEATATVGSASIVAVNSVFPTGLGATSFVGSAVGSTPISVTPTGVTGFAKTLEFSPAPLFGGQTAAESSFASLTGAESEISFELGVGESVAGVEATSAVGSVVVNGDANAPVTGLSATASVGSVGVVADANVAVTGVAGTGNVGSVTVVEGQGTSPLVSAPRIIGRLGVVTAVPETNVFLTGVAGTGEVGDLNQTIWNPIDPSQSTTWTEIAA